MTLAGWLQIILIFAIVVAAAWPLGIGMARLFTRAEPTGFERGLYRIAGVDATKEQGWATYTLAMLAVNLFGFIVLYVLQRLQYYLPLNPQGFAGDERAPVLQHRHQLRHQHQLAVLWRRDDASAISCRWPASPCRISSPPRPASRWPSR